MGILVEPYGTDDKYQHSPPSQVPSHGRIRWTPAVTWREGREAPSMMEIIFSHEPGQIGARSPKKQISRK